jgi:anti-sigma-K factor RskA
MTDSTAVPGAGDLDSLLGAYALDALEADDRARVDAYLEEHAEARAEVDEMRETAASLALLPDSSMTAPPELWDRIAEVIAADDAQRTEHAADGRDQLTARRARRSRMNWMVPAAAAAAIALVVLAAQVVSLHSRLDKSQQLGTSAMAAAFNRAEKVDGAREVGLKAGSGATLARVVLLPDGTGYLRGDKLAALGPDKTYQLWAVTGSAKAPVVVSAGVLGPHPSAIGFRASGPVHGFAVTVETASGVVASHHTPVAQGVMAVA